jgi:raffinose/stachyose/melibiose transport system permease protein
VAVSSQEATVAVDRSAPVRRPGRRSGTARRHRPWLGLAYLAPGLLVYAVVVLVPVGQGVWLSFFHWDGVTAATWAGFANYSGFFTDPTIRAAAEHTLVFIAFFSLLPIALGLLSAALTANHPGRAGGLFRAIVFIPQTLTPAVTAVVWKRIYAPNGPINDVLKAVGLNSLSRGWLGDYSWALPALGIIGTWGAFGVCTLMFLSGMQAISRELYDAARVDGAGAVREFFTVTLPGLRGPLAVVLTLTIIAAIRIFDVVWLTTRGGPGTSTITPTVVLYERAFANPDIGSAAAIGVIMSLLALAITMLVIKLAGERD